MAQTPRAEISWGWSFLIDESDQYPIGFQAGGAWRFTDTFAMVGDFAFNELPELRLIRTQWVTTFSGGPRFYFGESVTGFAHVLVGVIRWAQRAPEPFIPEVSFREPLERTETAFLIQPGGGVDIPLSDRFAMRLQGDYQWHEEVLFAPAWYLRLVAGMVYYPGQH